MHMSSHYCFYSSGLEGKKNPKFDSSSFSRGLRQFAAVVSGLGEAGYGVANLSTHETEVLTSLRAEMMNNVGAIKSIQKDILDVDELCLLQRSRITRLMVMQFRDPLEY